MRSAVKQSGFIAARLCMVLAFFGCTHQVDWYPDGSAEIIESIETESPYGTMCTIFYKVENTGGSVIRTSTLSIRVDTSSRSYFRSIVDDTRLLPGGTVFGSVEVLYQDPAPEELLEKVSLESCFFE